MELLISIRQAKLNEFGCICMHLVFCIPLTKQIHWLRGIRRGSSAVPFLGLRVLIPPGAWLSVVSVVCC